MTILLVFGLFVGLYMARLLFSLAVHALPVATGISLVFWLHGHNCGFPTSILTGFVGAVAVLVAGQCLFAGVRAPAIRLCLAGLFAIPAGIAGYHVVAGIAGLALDRGAFLTMLSWFGAFAIGTRAWTSLADPASTTPTIPATTPAQRSAWGHNQT